MNKGYAKGYFMGKSDRVAGLFEKSCHRIERWHDSLENISYILIGNEAIGFFLKLFGIFC